MVLRKFQLNPGIGLILGPRGLAGGPENWFCRLVNRRLSSGRVFGVDRGQVPTRSKALETGLASALLPEPSGGPEGREA